MNNVVDLTKEKEPRTARIAIPVTIKIQPDDSRNCYIQSWDERCNVSGRCHGVSTILDSSDLVCGYFDHEEPQDIEPGEDNEEAFALYLERLDSDDGVEESAILLTPNGEVAQWGQAIPVRRCMACIIGEQIMKKGV